MTNLSPGEVFPALIVLSGLTVGLIIVVLVILAGIFKTRAREETKREIAAYVAEGSIDSETAIALIQADVDPEDARPSGTTRRTPKKPAVVGA